MDHFAPERALHVYDSFKGLPPPGENDAYLKEGECRASVEDLLATLQKWDAQPPTIHQGWFADTLATELPDQICFGSLDGDFYESTLTPLEHVYPRLAPNAII